jgi:hypothetical protein
VRVQCNYNCRLTTAVTTSHDQPKPTCAREELDPDVNSSSQATKAHVDTWKMWCWATYENLHRFNYSDMYLAPR